jgi:hypothetical protein
MEEFFSGCGAAKTPVSMACDVRSMVIRLSYCKEISRYVADTRLLGLAILQGRFVYATELGSLGWSTSSEKLRMRGRGGTALLTTGASTRRLYCHSYTVRE